MFDDAQAASRFRSRIDLKGIIPNVAAALISTVLSLLCFEIVLGFGQAYQPITAGVYEFLAAIALAVVLVGAVLLTFTEGFPWLAAVLILVILGGLFGMVGVFVTGLELGGMASGLLLGGNFTARGVRWLGIRSRSFAPPKLRAIASKLMKDFVTNLAGASIVTVLAFLYSIIGPPGGDRPPPLPISAYILPALIALAAVLVGAVFATFTKEFPWLAAVLTPLLIGSVFRAIDPKNPSASVWGFEYGCIASGLYLVGAGAGQSLRWIRTRRHPPDTAPA